MYKYYKIFILITFALCICISITYGKTQKDSATTVINNITTLYKSGKISDTAYLDSVYLTIQSFQSTNITFTNKENLELLTTFREIAWSPSHEQDWKHKRLYYAMLSNQAQFANRAGEMLYYAEKIDNLEQKAYQRPSLTALSIIDGYYETRRAPQNIVDLYNKSKKYLLAFPGLAKKGLVSVTDLVQAVIVLQKSARAFYELKDIAAGTEAESLIAQIAAIAQEVYKANNNVMANIADRQRLALYHRGIAENNTGLLDSVFRNAEASLASSETPDYLKNAIYADLVDWKTKYYLAHYNADSVAAYLKIYSEMIGNDPFSYDRYLLNKFKARDLYNRGKYKESADLLGTSVEFLDSSQAVVGKDMDDLLYANAKAEENHILLQESEVKRLKSEKAILLTIGIIAILILSGLLFLRYSRKKQQSRFLQFKINIARNIHDETNPALLYAKALVKASRDNPGNKGLLELHIDHTMEVIRSLSHDLKSDKLHTIADLKNTITETLQKLNTDNTFTYNITTSIDEKRFLSHYQFSQLKYILQEAITNTIRHASFSIINIALSGVGNQLNITYNDNGKGWEESAQQAGIGIKNMKERADNLNGTFSIKNDYPNGYQLSVSALLR